jgi:hypothetical protein
VTGRTVDTADPETAEHDERFELSIELGASYPSLAAHGRALASLLLALHGWIQTQEADSVDVTLDGRTFTLRGRDREPG